MTGFVFPDLLDGPTFQLRPLTEADLPDLQRAASDPGIWAGHPSRDRHKPEVFADYGRFLLHSGGTLVVRDRALDRIVGCSRFYVAEDAPQDVAIGFTFLARAYWGGPGNHEIKTLMLTHAFAHVDRVWFHIDPTNIRSQKATRKLGAVHTGDPVLDLAGTPVTWQQYRLSKADWHSGRDT